MILTCPECATRYLAKDETIGPNGRTVRCSNCDATWFVAANIDELILKDNQTDEISMLSSGGFSDAAAVGAVPPPPSAQNDTDASFSTANPNASANANPNSNPGAHVVMRDAADRRRLGRRRTIIGFIWGIVFILLAVAAIVGYTYRQDIVQRVPQTATFYKSLGIKVSDTGLVFGPSVAKGVMIDGSPVLVINGRVKNISDRALTLPLVALSLKDRTSETLAEWRVEFQQETLEAGADVEFVSQYPAPPPEAVSLTYRFVEEDLNIITAFDENPVGDGSEDLLTEVVERAPE